MSQAKSAAQRRKWSGGEDAQLRALVARYGDDAWKEVSARMSTKRNPKQCRERYMNHLDPAVRKGQLSAHEWQVLIDAHKRFGNKWCEIAKLLPGRAPNTLKNTWNSNMRLNLGIEPNEPPSSVRRRKSVVDAMEVDTSYEDGADSLSTVTQSPMVTPRSPPRLFSGDQPFHPFGRSLEFVAPTIKSNEPSLSGSGEFVRNSQDDSEKDGDELTGDDGAFVWNALVETAVHEYDAIMMSECGKGVLSWPH